MGDNQHKLFEMREVLQPFSVDDRIIPGFQSTCSGGSTSFFLGPAPDIPYTRFSIASWAEATAAETFFTVHGFVDIGSSQRFNNVWGKVNVAAA